LLSCGDGDDPQPVSATPTFLKVGTRLDFYYDDGFFFEDSIRTIVDGQLATDTFLVRHFSETIAVGGTQYWTIKDNDFYTSIRLRDPSTYILEFRFGQHVGTSWPVVKAGVSYTYSIEALNETVTTGDGPVTDAIKIKVKAASGQESINYISPTVGLLGTGSVSEATPMRLIHYRLGSQALITASLPPITYGNFNFMAVAKYWNYTESSLFGGEVDVNVLIEGKVPSTNIFKVKITYDGVSSYSYWYEDNGMLMAYDDGENLLNADPIYMRENIAQVGWGWASITGNGTLCLFKRKEEYTETLHPCSFLLIYLREFYRKPGDSRRAFVFRQALLSAEWNTIANSRSSQYYFAA
jgi:hypothetical protein